MQAGECVLAWTLFESRTPGNNTVTKKRMKITVLECDVTMCWNKFSAPQPLQHNSLFYPEDRRQQSFEMLVPTVSTTCHCSTLQEGMRQD
jgi:hypothetical protein